MAAAAAAFSSSSDGGGGGRVVCRRRPGRDLGRQKGGEGSLRGGVKASPPLCPWLLPSSLLLLLCPWLAAAAALAWPTPTPTPMPSVVQGQGQGEKERSGVGWSGGRKEGAGFLLLLLLLALPSRRRRRLLQAVSPILNFQSPVLGAKMIRKVKSRCGNESKSSQVEELLAVEGLEHSCKTRCCTSTTCGQIFNGASFFICRCHKHRMKHYNESLPQLKAETQKGRLQI